MAYAFPGGGGEGRAGKERLLVGAAMSEAKGAPKRSRGPKDAGLSDHPQFALTKAVQQMNQKQEAFLAGVETFKALSADLELRYSSKRKQLDDLDEEFVQKQKTRKFELELALKEEGYQRAVQILAERGETALQTAEWNKLKEEYEVLKRDKAKEVSEVRVAEAQKWVAEKKQLEEMSKLRHEAENAKHVAELDQFKTHIKVLQDQISDLKKDADKQRDLTKALAEANRPQLAPPMPYARS